MKISPTQYAKVLVTLSEGGGDPSHIAASFLTFVRKRRGTRKLSEILRAAERIADEMAGRVSLLAETAVGTDDATKKDITKKAEVLFPGKTVSLRHAVRPALLGGVRLSSEDEVIDGSVQARLRAIGHGMRNRA